jgi:hypothetical protein
MTFCHLLRADSQGEALREITGRPNRWRRLEDKVVFDGTW